MSATGEFAGEETIVYENLPYRASNRHDQRDQVSADCSHLLFVSCAADYVYMIPDLFCLGIRSTKI